MVDQIAGKAYRTSLYKKIEDLKPAQLQQKNIRKFDLDRSQKGKGQHKGQFYLHFDTARHNLILFLERFKGFRVKQDYRVQ